MSIRSCRSRKELQDFHCNPYCKRSLSSFGEQSRYAGNIDVRFDPGMGEVEGEGDVEYSNFELIGFVGRCEGIGEI